ncbi:MAG: methyltransferase regulatory domain-containing protein [Pirellulaceae bacterium]|nr:methyltransferase regulatory domain-containing protein [Pirellulaceae bacterium]
MDQPEIATSVSYDQVPYNSSPFRQTHPCHLATMGTLFGMEVPRVSACRVLELGCAAGGNLIPMAQDLPEGEFVGIDLSSRQIGDGQQQIQQLGLPNIRLTNQSIMDVDESWGQFDYILCHGVFSWVPSEVQRKILDIGRQNLRPNGIQYVSYNTYPGWHLRAVVRDMMRYHVATMPQPQTKIDQARSLLEFLSHSATPRKETYRQLLKDEAEIIRDHSDTYLYHEHLEENNDPLYFHQFIERAEDAGLQYLADTNFSTMLATNFDSQTAAILKEATLLQQEQYMDFLRNRTFRQSLLCHRDVRLQRSVNPACLMRFQLALQDRMELPRLDLNSSEAISCPLGGEDSLSVSAPTTKAALMILDEAWPGRLEFESLFHSAKTRVDASYPKDTEQCQIADRARLAEDLMTLYARSLIHATIEAPPFVVEPGQRPAATPLARLQAQQGDCVTTRRHTLIRLQDLTRKILVHLDAQHDRSALSDIVQESIANGEFQIRLDGHPVPRVDRAAVEILVEEALKSLASNALLIH